MAMSLGLGCRGTWSSISTTRTQNLPDSAPPILASVRSVILLGRRRDRIIACAGESETTPPPRRTGGRNLWGMWKPVPVTPEMQDLLGVSEITRGDALKLIWIYIKENNLQVQHPDNKSVIVCDEKLKKVFGSDFVGFHQIAELIVPNFLRPSSNSDPGK